VWAILRYANSQMKDFEILKKIAEVAPTA